jgi:hypothetical protein
MTRSDRAEAALSAKVEAHVFNDADVLDFLGEMDIDTLIERLGEPLHQTEYAVAYGWAVGDGRPALANDDPAVMQSIARCATSRVRHELPAISRLADKVHGSSCDWDIYPIDELLKAAAWSVHQSGFVISDLLVWHGKDGSVYVRPGGLSGFQRREYRDFWALESKERERRIEAASGRKVAA